MDVEAKRRVTLVPSDSKSVRSTTTTVFAPPSSRSKKGFTETGSCAGPLDTTIGARWKTSMSVQLSEWLIVQASGTNSIDRTTGTYHFRKVSM